MPWYGIESWWSERAVCQRITSAESFEVGPHLMDDATHRIQIRCFSLLFFFFFLSFAWFISTFLCNSIDIVRVGCVAHRLTGRESFLSWPEK